MRRRTSLRACEHEAFLQSAGEGRRTGMSVLRCYGGELWRLSRAQ
jgi:hypothetical protein